METIWKYELEIKTTQIIDIPEGAHFLSLQSQFEKPCVWFLIPDTNAQTTPYNFITFGTGHDTGGYDRGEISYLGTYQSAHGHFVGHVFATRQ